MTDPTRDIDLEDYVSRWIFKLVFIAHGANHQQLRTIWRPIRPFHIFKSLPRRCAAGKRRAAQRTAHSEKTLERNRTKRYCHFPSRGDAKQVHITKSDRARLDAVLPS